jgi:hypothetical protein
MIDEGDFLDFVRKKTKGAFDQQLVVNQKENVELQDSQSSRKTINDLPYIDQQLLFIVMAKKEQYVNEILSNSSICLNLAPETLSFIEKLKQILECSDDEQQKKELKVLFGEYDSSWKEHWKRSYCMLKDQTVDMEKSFQQCLSAIEKMRLLDTRKLLELQLKDPSISTTERAEILARIVKISKQVTLLK